MTPLDLVKCNTQANPQYFKGTFSGFRSIMSGEVAHLGFGTGLTGLAKGWGPTAVGYSAQGAFKFGLYEYFKYSFASRFSEETAHKYRDLIYIAASASAEVVADVALCPFEAVKVRVQTSPSFARGMMDGIPKMAAQEGFGTLFAGLVPLWARQVPYTVIKFVAFERIAEVMYGVFGRALNKRKEELDKTEQLMVVFSSGYLAGLFEGFRGYFFSSHLEIS